MAIRIGVSIAEYNDLTPRELFLILDGYNDRQKQHREDIVTQAHYTAAFQRQKKLAKLEKVLEDMRPKAPKRPQTPEQMLAAAMRFNLANGGSIERGEG